MVLSDSMRRLAKKWAAGGGHWPKRLDWLSVDGMRGWAGQRVEFSFPIVALVGENGAGKSTVLQAAASAYRSSVPKNTLFPSAFFPSTHWDPLQGVSIGYGCQEGTGIKGPIKKEFSLRKPTTRWLGHGSRPLREVRYVDLSRIQPLAVRIGYAKIGKQVHTEASASLFEEQQVKRLSEVMGRDYDAARMARASIDLTRDIPVITKGGTDYSGFHQGCGETTVMELLRTDFPKYGLVLIDEIESSLHPRAQRRLMNELAERCREREAQVILTTHSPYVLEALPFEARLYILESVTASLKRIVPGVSPQFAISKMDDELHPECDVYVEDNASKIMLGELLMRHAPDVYMRSLIVPFGAASVGEALGQMVQGKRFPRPTCVFLDGDSSEAAGCVLLPGGDAPERVVFNALRQSNWGNLWSRIARDISRVSDECTRAMTLGDHHDWVHSAANQLKYGGDALWQAMCAEWAQGFPASEAKRIAQVIDDALDG